MVNLYQADNLYKKWHSG